MATTDDNAPLGDRLANICRDAARYFRDADPKLIEDEFGSPCWSVGPDSVRQSRLGLRHEINALSVDIAATARTSPLVGDADAEDLRRNTRQMLATVNFCEYRYQGVYIHHDEDVVLGVDPPTQSEVVLENADDAQLLFARAADGVRGIVDLLSPREGAQSRTEVAADLRPKTAFIMMAIDDSKPDLEDVKRAIKEIFEEFGVEAIAADDIEHSGMITERILEEIRSREFLIADLTYERPNVYYEVGYAHAYRKTVILYRKKDTALHFDLSHRNCPVYNNITGLKEMLRARVNSIIGDGV